MELVKVPRTIENSKYRKEIDDMLSEGKSINHINKWLREHGEGISRQSLTTYHKFCFNINAKAEELYTQEQSEEKLVEAARKEVNALKLYDKIISEAMNVNTGAVDPVRLLDLALKAGKQRQEHIDAVGDQYEEERIQVLKDIREFILSAEVRKELRGLKTRRSFNDPTPD